MVSCAAVIRAGLARRGRVLAGRRALRHHVAVRDLVVADDVIAVGRDAVFLREVVDELRARGVLRLGVRLRVVADVLDADRALVVPVVSRVPRRVRLGHELADGAVLADDVLDALSGIVLERRDARVPAALGVVDDDVADAISGARRVALVGAVRREDLGAGIVRQRAHRLLGDGDLDCGALRADVRHQRDRLRAARLERAACAERLEDALRVLHAVALVGVAREVFERGHPGGEVLAARARLATEIREDERARAEAEIRVAANVVLRDSEEPRAERERVDLAATELERSRDGDLRRGIDGARLRHREPALDARDGDEQIARDAALGRRAAERVVERVARGARA